MIAIYKFQQNEIFLSLDPFWGNWKENEDSIYGGRGSFKVGWLLPY